MMQSIRTLEELYAHALAIEREAIDRYREFGAWFGEKGEEVLARLCAGLAQMEEEHHRELAAASRDLSLPAIPAGEYRWLEGRSPEAPPHELLRRVAGPRQLLEIALQAERAALAFFGWVEVSAPDEQVRAAAHSMVRDEELHVVCLRNAIEYHLGARAADGDELMDV
jgi:rubrerythrin